MYVIIIPTVYINCINYKVSNLKNSEKATRFEKNLPLGYEITE